MPVPKQKKSRTRRNTRRANISLASPTLVACPKCRDMKPTHRVCPHCGYYKGREIVRTEPQ